MKLYKMGKLIDLTNKRFGHLIAQERVGTVKNTGRNATWKCLCDCGNITVIDSSRLRSGNTGSCGCFQHIMPLRNNTQPTKHPTNMDIAWVAGLYEGEGNCNSRKEHSIKACISQKDTWILEKARELFGGNIYTSKTNKEKASEWYLGGARARGFLMTIYIFLSPRRQQQIKIALGGN